MQRFARFVVWIVILLTGCGTSPESVLEEAVPDPTAVSPGELLELYREANAAYEAGDVASFCAITVALTEAWPDHPRLIFNRARCCALEGSHDEAFDLLDRLIEMRIAIDPTDDQELVALHELPRFGLLMERYAAAIEPTTTSEVAFRLDDGEFVPEDVAWDPVSGDLFISSIRKRKIVRIDEQGRQTLFAGYPEIDMLAALSMAVDSDRRLLWLTTAATPSMIGYMAEEHEGQSELLGFDLESGELLVRVAAPAEGDQHELNDLAIDASGAVLVGDAPLGAIYRLSAGAETFETIVAPGSMFSPQGIVILPDSGQTLIADYSRGLCLLRADGRVQVLKSPPGAWLGGIDGLSQTGRRELFGVQNGVTPNRVVRIRLTEKVDGVEAVDVLDLAHPEYDQPTLGEVVGGDFLYVANSLWGAWDRDGNLVEGRKLSPPVILRISLD
jgi:sugar lactone lactonase YvrE